MEKQEQREKDRIKFTTRLVRVDGYFAQFYLVDRR